MRYVVLLALVIACGDDSSVGDAGGLDASADAASDANGTDAASDSELPDSDGLDSEMSDSGAPPAFVGGDRPTRVIVPPGYDPSTPAPLLILLHGYTASGFIQGAYFGLTAAAGDRGMLLLQPDGTMDGARIRHWNATPACCGVPPRDADDLGYVTGLIDEMKTFYSVDASRVYLLGHSNGGFMSYRIACDAADQVTAIATLAGATFGEPTRCDPARPISVLQIHGTLDGTILFAGGTLGGNSYPSAMESVQRFATRAGCTGTTVGDPLDFDSLLPGAETMVETHTGCMEGLDPTLWTIVGGAHLPTLSSTATEQALDWLLTHEL